MRATELASAVNCAEITASALLRFCTSASRAVRGEAPLTAPNGAEGAEGGAKCVVVAAAVVDGLRAVEAQIRRADRSVEGHGFQVRVEFRQEAKAVACDH